MDRLSELKINVPPILVVDTVVFVLFALACFFMILSAISSRANFKPADVDVLFPTPISPKIVLVFRMIRDSLLTLIIPLLIALFAIKPVSQGWDAMFRGIPPGSAAVAQKNIWIAWLLLSIFTVVFGYATGLYFNRPEVKMEKLRAQVGWLIGIVGTAFSAFVVWRAASSSSFLEACRFLSLDVIRIPLFIADAATQIVVAPLNSSLTGSMIGYATLLVAIAAALAAALKQAPFLYEQASARAGFLKSRNLHAQGDTITLLADEARKGNFKVQKDSRLMRLNMHGAMALVWKDLVLTARTSRILIFLAPVLLFMIALMILGTTAKSSSSSTLTGGAIILTLQFALVFLLTIIMTQQGYIEMLRRVDLQKPLPFSPAKIVLYEVVSKSLFASAISIVASLAVLIMRPAFWLYSIGGAILAPAFSFLVCAVSFGVTVPFPDFEDPTQRSFRGLMQMLALVIFAAPAVTVLVVLLALKVPPVLAAILPTAINLGLALVATAVGGNIYSGYNPSE